MASSRSITWQGDLERLLTSVTGRKLQTQHVLDQQQLELWIAEREATKTPEQALEAEQKQQFLEHPIWVDMQMKNMLSG